MEKMNKRERRKRIKFYFNKVAKLLSYAIIVVLIFLGIFFAYYFVSLKAYEKNPTVNIPRFGLYTIISPSMEPSALVIISTTLCVTVKPFETLLFDINVITSPFFISS